HSFDAIFRAKIELGHETNLENAGPVVQKEVTQALELNPAGRMPAGHTDRMPVLRIRGRR
ncbi:MAG: hypothetical protein DME77_02085, partial [Verrucomicrobia bacterium]